MITRVGRRVLELGVLTFALLGFAFVPLGKKTALEHAKAILATEPAKEAGQELLEAGAKLRARWLEVIRRPEPPAKPESLMCSDPAPEPLASSASRGEP